MTNIISNTLATVREKFHHIAVLGGPQYSAALRMYGVDGKLYVSELNQWLWIPQTRLASSIITDQELEGLVSPLEICQTLLLSAENTMIQLIHQMDYVQARARRDRILSKEPGISHADLIISELFRVQVQAGSHTTGRVM